MKRTVSIIGGGWRTACWIKVLNGLSEGYIIKKVYCRNEEKRKTLQRTYNVVVGDDYSEIFSDKPGIVILCVSRESNIAVAKELVKNGLDVLCETPLFLSDEDFAEIEIGANYGKLFVAENYPFHPIVRAYENIIESGAIGEVCGVNVSYCHGYHAASIIRGLLGVGTETPDEVKSVSFGDRYADIYYRNGKIPEKINDYERTISFLRYGEKTAMKGMVGISLKDGESIFETKVKLDNTTDMRKSFLWWENTAVPVNENYGIFFPEDVNYVRFHYKRSVTTFPIANNDRFGAYNGIYYNGDTDISRHKNTRSATSYFSAESEYDYFGGYDFSKKRGIVHIADHHISPGKKMFTWAYGQLAKTWENALTDNDGQYAELMAGVYSDNQPDLSWIMPNETKKFSQKWYPIHGEGTPVYANENIVLYNKEKLTIRCDRAGTRLR